VSEFFFDGGEFQAKNNLENGWESLNKLKELVLFFGKA